MAEGKHTTLAQIFQIEEDALPLRASLLPAFGFRVSGFGFRVSGFGFRVSGFGFRVSDQSILDGSMPRRRAIKHSVPSIGACAGVLLKEE